MSYQFYIKFPSPPISAWYPLPPVKATHTGLGILFSAVKGVLDDYDTLADLLESVEHFLNRLDIYTKIYPTVSMTEMIIKILVELLFILASATKQLQQGKLKALVKKKLLWGKDIEAVLQRWDRLTEDEARITAAQTLEVVQGLFQNMRDVVDDGKTTINHVRDALGDKSEKDIRTWLSPPDPWKNYNIARKLRQAGLRHGSFRATRFSEWKRSEASLLWVHGKPKDQNFVHFVAGAGKSVLCSTFVEDIDAMRKAGLASLAFFYCDLEKIKRRTCVDFFRRSWSNFVINPTPTVMCFQVILWTCQWFAQSQRRCTCRMFNGLA
ncbi:hypothetical protein V8E52_004616 [Russula decolorans]